MYKLPKQYLNASSSKLIISCAALNYPQNTSQDRCSFYRPVCNFLARFIAPFFYGTSLLNMYTVIKDSVIKVKTVKQPFVMNRTDMYYRGAKGNILQIETKGVINNTMTK